jgi:hypothetical protein
MMDDGIGKQLCKTLFIPKMDTLNKSWMVQKANCSEVVTKVLDGGFAGVMQ